MFGMFRSIWLYRTFIANAIRNEFRVRFARNKLGALWMLINPLTQALIYTLILSNVLAAKLPDTEYKYAYAFYLMAGLLAWTLFCDIINNCVTLFITQGNLMKKMCFPRITLPSIMLGSCLLNNLLLFFSILAIFFVLGHFPGIIVLWIIPLTLVVTVLASGIGLILGTFNVFIRDISQIVPIILQIGFWFTPIVYPLSIFNINYRSYFYANPMYALTHAYQEVLVYGHSPKFESIANILFLALMLMFLSLFIFRRASVEMVDAL